MGQAALLASCALLLTNLQASAATLGVDLGADGFQTGATIPPAQFNNAAIFGLGAGGGDIVSLNGSSQVFGDVAVQGSGNTKLGGSSKINGRLSYKSTGNLSVAPKAAISGPIYHNSATDSLLTAGTAAALNASSAAFGFAPTAGTPTTLNQKINLTLSTGVNTRAVYTLQDFKLANNVTLTLQGTASSAFVFNVKNDFMLGTSSKVVLSGGLTWNHVLFNVLNKDVSMNDSEQITGILLAAHNKVTLSNSAQVTGGIIANQIVLNDSAKVTRPPIVSP
jgi:cytoskeletal protein CcmA (bactofilin family)